MMRMLRPALAVAAVFLINLAAIGADDLLTADREIADAVDHYIDAALRKESVTPAGVADDATLCRRLTLDLVGRIPTVDESRGYINSTDPRKRARLVDRLMGSSGFVRHQATELDTMLMAGNDGSLRDYLVKAVGENRPWDRMFRELMLPNQTEKVEKVAAEYLRQRVKDLDRLTADVSSTFFGVNISCAQCHDHPLVHDWKQDHFYGMKSFLARTFVNGNEQSGFLGEHSRGSIRFKTTEDVEKQARLMFLTGRRVEDPDTKEPTKDEQKAEKAGLDRSKKQNVPPPSPKFSARAKLVETALEPGEREFFARAIVNRIWYRLMGQGLVMPLDQMHSANPPSHPELLAWLARDTATHGYDLRRLIRGLVLSNAYARSSRWDKEAPPRPSLFAVALVRPLTPMQLASSAKLATLNPVNLPPDFSSAEFEKRMATIEDGARRLSGSFGSSSGDAQIGVSEALLFSNGKQIDTELLADGADRLVGALKAIPDHAKQVKFAVLTVLARPPDDDEVRVLGEFVGQRTDRPEDACQQLVWALLTSSEFRFNH